MTNSRPTTLSQPSIGLTHVRSAIGRAAQRTGVNFDYLWNQARTESSLDPSARARTSSAAGLFQFIEQSWLGVLNKHGAKHGYGWAADNIVQRSDGRYSVADPETRRAILALRYDPDAASIMAGEFAADNADTLTAGLGRQPNATDLYFAHFLGPAGGTRFLRALADNPDASAPALFPREASANHTIFYDRSGAPRSLAQVYTMMGRKMGGSGEMPMGDGLSREPGLRLTSTLPEGVTDADGAHDGADMLTQPLMTAMVDRSQRFDPLRPNPQSARLAYMMVVSSLDS